MKTTLFALTIALVSTSVLAQQVIPSEEVRQLVSGKTVDFGQDGSASYGTDGKYEYFNKNNGSRSRGTWSLQGDRLCVAFDNGRSRCDQFLKDGGRTVLKDSQGRTFSVSIR